MLYLNIQTVPTNTVFKPGLDKSMFATIKVANELFYLPFREELHTQFLLSCILKLSMFLSIVRGHGPEHKTPKAKMLIFKCSYYTS